MKKLFSLISCIVIVLVASLTLSACGKSDTNAKIVASNSEIELILGTEQETKSVEFELKDYGSGSDQLNFDLEESEKDIVSISQKYKKNGKTVLEVKGLSRGTARIFVTSLQGSQKFVLTVKVIQPITGLKLKTEYTNSLYAVAGKSLSLSQQEIWNFIPSNTNQRDLVFSFVGESQGCEIVDGKLVVSENCTLQSVLVQATSASNPDVTTEFEVKIFKPIQVVLQMDGKTVVENVSSDSNEILNYLEIFPTEKDDSIYPNSKTVTLIVKAGSQDETLKIDKIFGTDLEKFSVLQTGYSYDSARKLHRFVFIIQANSQDAGNVDNITFGVSYDGYNAGESNYVENSVVLNLNSYNKPDSVEVNGQNKSVEIDIFENSINMTNGQLIELTILPGNLKSGENYITIWAKDFENLPVSLYRLNATRTGYICVFGYDKNGHAVGNESGTTRYAKIASGTKLYAFINNKYLSNTTNKSAEIYAQASTFCKYFTTDEMSRALTKVTFTINPNAKNVFIADKTDSGKMNVDQSATTIFAELGKTITQYIAIDPSSFTLSSNSTVKVANGNIATLGKLLYSSKDEKYVYGKFTIIPNKVGSTTIVVTLSDGKTVSFNLVVICPLEELDVTLEDVTFGGTVIESDIVPYKNISDTKVKVNEIGVTRQLNKLSIANSGGSGVQLLRNAIPANAQYYLEFEFCDFTIPDGKTLKDISMDKIDFTNITWSDKSSILNTARLNNSTILEALNAGVEGNVLVRIDVKAMKSDGTYTEKPAGSLFYLVNFFVPIKGITIKNGTVDVFSHDSIGDKFVDGNNVSKSIGSFSVAVNPVNSGLIPTYLQNLEIYVNGSKVNISEKFVNDLLYLNADGGVTYNLSSATLKITRKLENNTYTFTVQALKSCDNSFVFAMSISEINPDKKFTAIARVIVQTAVEINEIEVINAGEDDPIYIQNLLKSEKDFTNQEEYLEYLKPILENPYELDLVYNIFAQGGKEITNKSLEFEFVWDYLADKDYYIDENGNKQFFATMVDNKLTIVRAAYDYSDYFNLSEEERATTSKEEKKKLVQFGASGTLIIYPTSNYFESTNGWNGEEPIVRIPVKVADGKSSDSAFELFVSEDLKLLGESPASSFILRNNIFMPVDYEPVENFMGKLSGRYQSEITPYGIYAIKPLFKMIAESGVVEDMFYYTAYLPELGYTFDEYVSTYNGVTYYGGLANINKGHIKNIGSNYNGTLDPKEILENSDGIDVFGFVKIFKEHYKTRNADLDSLTTVKYKNVFNPLSYSEASVGELFSFLSIHDESRVINSNSAYGMYYGMEYKAGELVKYTGGLVGLNLGTIEATDDSLTKGYMATGISGANVGGIAGVNEGTIKNYTFIGGVIGVESAGGIVACNKGDLKDCKYINLVPLYVNVTLLILNNSAYSYSNEINFSAGGICAVSESGNIYGCVVEAIYDIDQHKDLTKFLPSDTGIVYVHYVEKINESAPKEYYNSIGGETAYTGAKPWILKGMSDGEIKAYFDSSNEKFPAEWKGLSIDEIFVRMNTSARDIYVGGIAGKSKNTQISRTVVDGALPIQESETGGFVGLLENDGNDSTNLIKDCYALIKVSAENIAYGYTAGQFISGGSLSEIKNSYVKSNFASLPLSKNGTGTPVSSFIGGTDKKTGLFDVLLSFSTFRMGNFQIVDLGTKSLKDLYNYGFAKVSLKNKTITLERVYNEGATNEQKDTFVVSANIEGDLGQKFNLDVNRFILRGSEVYLEQIYFADTEGTLYAYPESSVTIDLSQESTATRTIVGNSQTIRKPVGEGEVEFTLEKVLYYTRTVSSDGTLTLKFNVKLRETNQQTNEETLSDIKTETYTFKRTAQSSSVSKLGLCFSMHDYNSGTLSFYTSSWGSSSDADYIPDINFENSINLDLNSEVQDETINGYFYDENSLKYKDCPDTAYVSGYDSIVTVIDRDLNHVAINDINLLYYKLALIGIYKNLDEFLQESAWEKFSYYNPFESDAKFGPGEIEKAMIVDVLCNMFGFEGKYDPDTVSNAELKNAIKNVIEGTIIPQIKNSIADLKKDIATLKGQFEGTLGEGTGLGYQYGTKDLWLAVYQAAFGDTSDAETYLTKVAAYIDTAQGIKDFDADSLSLNNIGTLFKYVDAVYNAQYQIINLFFKLREDDDIFKNIDYLTIKGEKYSIEALQTDLMRTMGPLFCDSAFMIPSALGGTESFYSEDGIPTDIQGFIDAGWDIERMYDAEGNVIESESTWVFEDGILPYLRGTKVSQKVENYQLEVNPENKLDKTKLVKGTYNSDDYFLMFFNEVVGDLTNDPKAQAQLDKMNSVDLVDFIKIFNINKTGSIGNLADFAIRSSDINVIRIVSGRLQIVGTGFATITIEPIHRSLTAKEENVIKTIKIFVTNSIGSISIYEGINADESLDGKEDVTITKDRPSYFTVANKNTVSLNHSKYNLRTNPLAIQIEISYIDRDNNKIVAYKTGETTNHFDILGLTAGNETTKFAFGTFTVVTKANVLENVTYNFNFNVDYEQGYINSLMQKEWEKELSRNEEIYKDKTAEQIESARQSFIYYRIKIFNAVINNKLNYGFDFKVVVRAERILVSIDKAEIDPSTVLSSDAELVSNRTGDEIIMKIVDENGKIIDKLFAASVINGTMKNGKVSAKLIISIAEDQRQLVKETKTYKVVLTDSKGDVEKSFDLVVKPQEIINVTYTHHNRTDDSSENGIRIQDQPSSILVPGDSGILSINLFPSYATYSKIVLTSTIVNGNYVLMEQMYQSGDYYLPTSTTTDYDSERDVNILTIKNAGKTGNVYVRTKILDSVKEGLYFPITIQIYALDEDGNEYLAKVETITLISEVIEAANITINGEKDAVVARGTTANLKIKVGENQTLASYSLSEYDSSSSIHDFSSIYFNTSEYEIENGKKIYSGTLTVGLDAEIEGDGYFKVQTIVQKIINGRLESTTDSIEVRVVDFLVEGITIDGNDEQDNVFDTPSAIEKDLKFNFKLSETPEMISASQQKSIDRINKAKETFLNTVAYKYYFKSENKEYNYILNTDRVFTAVGDPGNISYVSDQKSIAHDLFYSSDMTPYISKSGNPQTNKYFTIRYDEENPTILTIVGTTVGTVNMTIRIGYRLPNSKQDDFITYNFAINVQLYSDEDKPTPIENAEQFITYLQNESDQYSSTNYILMNDIVLENFVPFASTNFASLDGNNKVITIKNFDLSAITSTNVLNLGLFVNVLENSTLKNLTVSYGELEDIIVDEKIFNSIYFGGIAVNNSGVIYNCEVVSLGLEDGKLTNGPTNGGIKIYFDASKSKHKLDTTTVQIAGLVVENNNGASITNCRVGGKGNFTKVYYDVDAGKTEQTFEFGKFDIVGQGDMSGFVIINNGLISASYFAGASIVNKTTSASLNATSGFVMYNNLGALITTSYTEGIKLTTDLSVNITGGGIESQGISAGFAYQNSGKITDCYTNIRLAGNSTGRLVSGFVYNNLTDGKLERCYSASTIVGELTTQMPFTGKNSREEIMQLAEKGLVDCYYLVKNVDTGSILEDKYGTGAQAVQISTFDETTFKTFAMTTKNDYDGVWMWNGLFPELVSANQKAISVRRIIKNYSSLISGGTSTASLDIFPYIQGYEYGSAKNPIIIRTADEFNRVFGQETTLTKNAYYAISQMYNKELGIVFGNYRLVSHIDFANLKYVENIKISSSIMALANRGNNCGSFDGNGLDIRNIEISLDGQSSVGIFSQITSGGVFKNASITVKSVSSGISGIYVGTVAGLVQNSVICNITVSPASEDDQNRSKITGQNIVGGVVGAVTGNSKISNLTSSISVVSGIKNAEKNIKEYVENTLRDNLQLAGGIYVDKNKDYGFVGGIVGLLDIYESVMDETSRSSKPNAVNLKYFGQNISVQGSFVGGVVGLVGKSTYLANASFILTGTKETLNQRLISYENTIGGIVGVSFGDLFELGIEHENELQKEIEANIKDYYSSSNQVFRGNTKLFNSTGETLEYAGGIVGQMLGGTFTTSFCGVDVAIAGAKYAGGVIGLCDTSANLFELYALGSVDAKVAGGLIGHNLGTITLDKCTAINFYNKDNSTWSDIITSANFFNFGNVELTDYSGIGYYGNEGTERIFTINNNLVLTLKYKEVTEGEYVIKGKDSNKNGYANFELFGKTLYVTNEIKDEDNNTSRRYPLFRKLIKNDENFVAVYYYLKADGSEVNAMYEAKDGQLYYTNAKTEEEKKKEKVFFVGDYTYCLSSFSYVKDDNVDKDDNVNATFGLNDKDKNVIATFGLNDKDKIDTINLKNVSALIGSQKGTEENETEEKEIGSYSILYYNIPGAKAVFANKSFTFGNFKFTLGDADGVAYSSTDDKQANKSADKLTLDLDKFQSYEQNAPVVNKMFIGSYWNAGCWELREGRILPTLYFGVTSKVLYIEKPSDLLKLTRYYKLDNVVIFGDNPTTTFNPYNYKPGASSTYGEFEASELLGLTVKGEQLIFDFSAIEKSLSVAFEGAYFPRFLGTMYAEKPGNVVLTGMNRAFFGNITGAKISDLIFDGNPGGSGIAESQKSLSTAVLANTITTQTQLSNLTFKNLKIVSAQSKVGVVAGEIIGVVKLGKITIEDCSVTSTSTGDLYVTEEKQNKIGTTLVQGKKDKIVYVGGIAGSFVNSTSQPAEIVNNKISGLEITTPSLKAEKGENALVYVGGLFGETGGSVVYKYNAVTDITINAESISKAEDKNDKNDRFVYAGGYVGFAQGTTTILSDKDEYQKETGNTPAPGDNDKILSNLIITTNVCDAAYVGLLFGKSIMLETKIEGKNWTVSIAGSIKQGKDYTAMVVGGVSGEASNVNSFAGVEVSIDGGKDEDNNPLDLNLKTNTYGNGIVSTVGGLFGTIVGNATIRDITFGSKITLNSGAELTGGNEVNTDSLIAVGGIIGLAQGEKLEIADVKYSGNLTLTLGEYKSYIGGIVGYITTSKEASLKRAKFSGTIDETTHAVHYVGGLVGCVDNSDLTAKIEQSKVSGNIEMKGLSAGNFYVGGIIGSTNAITTISNNYAWGNIKNSKPETGERPESQNIGGILGAISNGQTNVSLTGNYCLTSLYIPIKGSETNNVRAFVGVGGVKDDSSGNFYCHQINLATDVFGENLYYNKGDNSILKKLISLKDDKGNLIISESEKKDSGTKLNPKKNPSLTADLGEGYYVLICDYTSIYAISKPSAVALNGHLVGDGYTIAASGDQSIFGTISGYISGVKIQFTSKQYTGTENGRVLYNENMSDSLPSGVANENNGIIFALSVEVSGRTDDGFKLLEASFGTVQGTVVAGVVGTNNGKISDTGVVLNVKSAFAGFVGNNQGIIENSYSTGAVHSGAQHSFCAGNSTTNYENKGRVYNSFTAIKQANGTNVTDCQNVVSSFFYDLYAVEIASTSTSGVGKLTSKLVCTIGDLSGSNELFTTNSNGVVWIKKPGYNFGYPTFNSELGAYSNFGYLDIATTYKRTINDVEVTFYALPHVGFLGLMSGKTINKGNNYAFMTDMNMADMKMDNNTTWKTITTNSGTIDGQGYHIYGLNAVQFVGTNSGTIKNLALVYDSSKFENQNISSVINENTGALDGIIVSGATCTDAGLVKYNSGTIKNCQNYNTVSGGANAGGIVSEMNSGIITGCRNFGPVTSSNGNAGGIVGKVPLKSDPIIRDCANFGDVTVEHGGWVGGIVGEYKLYTGTQRDTIGPGTYPYKGTTSYTFKITDKNLNVSVLVGFIDTSGKVGLRVTATKGSSEPEEIYKLKKLYTYSKSMNVWYYGSFTYMYDNIAIFMKFGFRFMQSGRYDVDSDLKVVDRFNYYNKDCYSSESSIVFSSREKTEYTDKQKFKKFWDNLDTSEWPYESYYSEAVWGTDYLDYADIDNVGGTIDVYTGAGLAYALYIKQNYTVNLMADIDLSQYVWKPVSDFTGTFNGNGYKIYFSANQGLPDANENSNYILINSDATVTSIKPTVETTKLSFNGFNDGYEYSIQTSEKVKLYWCYSDDKKATLFFAKDKNNKWRYWFENAKVNPDEELTEIIKNNNGEDEEITYCMGEEICEELYNCNDVFINSNNTYQYDSYVVGTPQGDKPENIDVTFTKYTFPKG